MEKLDDESAAKFITALTKSVQTLCHGFLNFHNGIEIVGYINLNVDKGSNLHYVLEEKVCKNEENSTLFISNSFRAQSQKNDSKTSENVPSGSETLQRSNSTDMGSTGKLSSAISSISSALSRTIERSRTGSTASARETDSHSKPVSNTAKRKASDDYSEVRSAKSSHVSSSPSPVGHFLPHSSPHGLPGQTSPVDSKAALRDLRGEDLSGMVLPQTAGISGDGGDLGVNLAGSVLERVDDHSNSDLADRGDDSDNDLEVTFIKEEYVEGEQSSCQFENSSGQQQQYGRGTHQRASSSDNLPDTSMYGLHPSASATYVPSAQDLAAQHYGPSTSSQLQPGTPGVRDSILFWGLDARSGKLGLDARSGKRDRNVGFEIASEDSANVLSGEKEFWMPGGKRYQCNICDYSNDRMFNFRRHMRRHTGELFECELCGVKYNCKNMMAKHKRKKHSEDILHTDTAEQDSEKHSHENLPPFGGNPSIWKPQGSFS